MADLIIDATQLDKLAENIKRVPEIYRSVTRQLMEQSLYIIWSEVPPYPGPGQVPQGVDISRRRGTLGRSLGVGEGGEQIGRPEIFKQNIESSGGWNTGRIGRFGTRLEYAKRVIGKDTQGHPWRDYWWTLDGTVVNRARGRIVELWRAGISRVAKVLEGVANRV